MKLSLEPFAFDLPRDRAISGRMAGQADLARIGRILALDGQRLAGRLDIDVSVTGTMAQPAASGSIVLANGAVEDASTGVLLRDLQVQIVGNQDRLVLQQLQASDRGNGKISGSGEMQLAGLSPSAFKVALTIEHFRALRNRMGTAEVSGGLTFSGNFDTAALAGTVHVDRADLTIPEAASGGPPTLDVQIAGAPPPVATAGEKVSPLRIGLDIKVEIPGRVFVRGHGLESEWQGNLTVTGTAAAPQVLGQITVRRGFIDVLGRRFVLDKGVIDFDGRQPPVPAITITAIAQSQEIKAIVSITGPADRLKLELSSEPVSSGRDRIAAPVQSIVVANHTGAGAPGCRRSAAATERRRRAARDAA